jgi:hypothetical protein
MLFVFSFEKVPTRKTLLFKSAKILAPTRVLTDLPDFLYRIEHPRSYSL